MQYIDPEAQLPPIDTEQSKEVNTPVSKRVICLYKESASFGFYYYDLKCWQLDTGMQPIAVELWAFLPPAIEGLNVIRSTTNPITYD